MRALAPHLLCSCSPKTKEPTEPRTRPDFFHMRDRRISPGFFSNDELLSSPPLARILFAGLWCLGDREGRVENHTQKIKLKVLPMDDCNIVELLELLEKKEFILRYEVAGKSYIQILMFHKHQSPHHMELPTGIPPPPGTTNRFHHAPITKEQRRRIFDRDKSICQQCSAKQGRLSVRRIKSFEQGGTSDDDNLRVLCGVCEEREGERETKNEMPRIEKLGAKPINLVEMWNTLAHPNLPRVSKITDQRNNKCKLRLNEHPNEEFWKQVIARINASGFLTGQNNQNWRADLDWLTTNQTNVMKIIEGKYDDSNKKSVFPKS